MVKHFLIFFIFLFPIITFAQIVEEKIQIDHRSETIRVIYKPQVSTTYYKRKIAVFADDTSRIAIVKSYTENGINGICKVYYPSGKLKIKAVYANNRIHGEWTYFAENGSIIIKGSYLRGIKHGYWAYKSLKTYGRYKKGLRSWNWHKIDENGKRHRWSYRRGELIRGEEFSVSVPEESLVKSETKDTLVLKEYDAKLSKEYKQSILFLRDNLVFKKKLKAHFSKGKLKDLRALNKYFVRDEFQFVIAPLEMDLQIHSFVEDSKSGNIIVSKIDSSIKNYPELQIRFSKSRIDENKMLYNNSTNKASKMGVYFSKIHKNLLRLDVVKFTEEIIISDFKKRYESSEKAERFELLLYFDNNRSLKGVEYEKN